MIVSITGTPGTGKNIISKLISKKLGWKLVDLNRLAEEKGLIKGFDKKRGCSIIDLSALRKEIKKLKKDLVVQSHYAHEVGSDLVIVLRTNPEELRKRMEKRGWAKEKVEENLEAEIMEICKDEALQKTEKVFEVDTTSRDPEKAANQTLDIIFREAFEPKKDLKLPKGLLVHFKKPYGKLFRSEKEFLKYGIRPSEKGLLICIGDLASYSLIESGFSPDIIVVDGKVKRKPFLKKIKFKDKKFKVINKPGLTTRALWNTIRKAMLNAQTEKIKVSVVGEDDLGVLPSVIMAPLGSVVVYGQPELVFEGNKIQGGLVAIQVDLEKKKNAVNLFRQMEKLQ